MQRIMPLGTSSLAALPYPDAFPSLPQQAGAFPGGTDDGFPDLRSQTKHHDITRNWKVFIGTIWYDRTVDMMTTDLWRPGIDGWANNPQRLLERTKEALKTLEKWYVCQIINRAS